MNEFPQTQWSLIDLAFRELSTGSQEHIGKLLETYWQPMYSHLRYKGVRHEKAEDLVQEFTIQILNGDLLSIADPKKGKFRTLLLTALDRFAITKHRYDTAAKRSPGELVSLNAMETDATSAGTASPTAAFDRAWALDVLAQALATMKKECEDAGETVRWSIFEQRVIAPLLEDAEAPDYPQLKEQHGLKNDKAAMNLLVTAKRQFTRTLRDQIRAYVTRSPDSQIQIERLAAALQENEADPKSAEKLAKQLTEQMVDQWIEEEIEQLKLVLSTTRGAVHIEMDESRQTVLYKSDFLRKLAQESSSQPLNQLYDWGTGDPDVPLDILFQSVLDSSTENLDELAFGTFREQLCGATPDLKALEAIKDWANSQRFSRSQSIPRDVASALLYGAIAAAFVHHNTKISGLGQHAFIAGMKWVGDQDWVDESVKGITADALRKFADADKID